MAQQTSVSEFTVSGMVCGHCVTAITEEVEKIANVRDVTVDLTAGRVSVTSEGPVDEADVRSAIGEAGYEVAG